MPRVKRTLLWVVAAFCVYAVITSPTRSAGMVHTAGAILGDGAANIGHFFDALLSKS